MKTKIIPIEKAICDKEIYPRNLVNWVTVTRYRGAMNSGANFPPITVARLGNKLLGGKFIVVDGFHRLDAMKGNKETHITVEILEGLDKKGIYIESVKRNIGHGQQFSGQERTKIILTLEKWEMSKEQIAKIVRIPADKIEPFVAKRITRITETQEDIVLKRPLKHLAGQEMQTEPDQSVFANRDQLQLLNSMIVLLENKWIDTSSELVIEKIKTIKTLLEKY